MPEKHFTVKVESDHIKKLTAAKPIPALAELIWNAGDADATRIDVEIETNDLGMHSIIVRDDGHGIPHGEIEHLFGKLGGSWKTRGARSKTKSRILHGKEGKGRFKALALGRVVDWNIHYRENGILLGYTVTIIREDLVDVRVSEPKAVDPALHTGVEVRITELDRAYRSLEADQAVNSLAQIFALYLTDYSELSIFVDHERVDPSKLIANHLKMPLGDIVEGDKRYSAELDLIEWTIISNDLDPFAQVKTRQKDRPRGQIAQTEDGKIEVWVKTWSEIIAECKARLRFVQDHLQTNVSKEASLKYLTETYDKYLTGIEVGEEDAA